MANAGLQPDPIERKRTITEDVFIERLALHKKLMDEGGIEAVLGALKQFEAAKGPDKAV